MLRSRLLGFLIGLWLATALVLAGVALKATLMLEVVVMPGALFFEKVVLGLLPISFIRSLSGEFGEIVGIGLSVAMAILFWAVLISVVWSVLTRRRGKHEKYAA